MSHALAVGSPISKRSAILAAIAALAASAALATGTSAHQTLIHTHIARDGSVVVSGYDGGAALAPSQP